MKLALFASGNGSNVQAIIDAVEKNQLTAELVCLICDKPKAHVIGRAVAAHIPIWTSTYKEQGGKDLWEQAVVDYLAMLGVEMIILAGFMRIIGNRLLRAYPQRILNIHPSLLPQFPGLHSIQNVFAAGVSETGVTIHWVDEGVDTGPIVAQERIKIDPTWTIEQLASAIHTVEHRLYPQIIQQVIQSFT